MRRYWLFLPMMILVLPLFACAVAPEEIEVAVEADWLTVEPEEIEVAVESGWLAEYVSYVQKTMDSDGIPGLALAIVQGNETILAEGYGVRNIAEDAPVTLETLFHIGSTHKSMTAMMIATLVDDGLLEWDQPIVSFAPAFALSDTAATQNVTMRHLLNMSSGIPDKAEDDLIEEAVPEDVFELIRETYLLGLPGEEFSYSNLSASAGGYLSVLASGGEIENLYAGYASLLQESVLDPIGMETATIYASEAQTDVNQSQSYVLSSQGMPILSESYDFDGDALAPAGSLKANVNEMALYVATQLNQGLAPNGNRVVSAKNLAETWQPYLEDYGMGWEIQAYEDVKMIFHTGAYDDFASVIGFIPEFDVGFVILVNSEEAGESLIEDAPYVLVEVLLEQ
ncbi:MAG: beta-lactamase family protein [Chloroflexi bacterium]|nr:beta-lactamase family protein [Chloroflexota bacterium]